MEWGDFGITPVSADHPLTRRLHLGFGVEDREAVDDWWRRMTEAGYTSDGEPGPRPEYTETYYGGFVLDPDGNSIEAVHHYRSRTGEIDHVWLRTTDIGAVKQFYETIAGAVGIELVREQPELVRYSDGAGSFTFVVGDEPTEHVHLAFGVERPGGGRSVSPARDRGRLPRQRSPRRASALPPRLLRGVRDRSARQQRRGRLPRPLVLTGLSGLGGRRDQTSRRFDDRGTAALHRACVQPATRITLRRRHRPRPRDRVDQGE